MSIHKSLRHKDTLATNRSVLTRWERLLKLKDDGRWKDGQKVTGLPKVRTKWKLRKRKKDTPAAAPAAGAAAAAPAAGAAAAGKAAAPAAGAKPAAAAAAAAPAAKGAKK